MSIRAPAWNGCLEGDELTFCQLGASARYDRKHVVRVALGIARAGKVLGGRRHSLVLQSAHRRRRKPTHGSWVVTEAADAERGVGRVIGHVTDRRVIDVDAERAQFARGCSCYLLGELLVAGRAQRHGAGELGRCHRPARQVGRPPGLRR